MDIEKEPPEQLLGQVPLTQAEALGCTFGALGLSFGALGLTFGTLGALTHF